MGGLGGDAAIYGVDAASEGVGFSFFHNGNLLDILTELIKSAASISQNNKPKIWTCLYQLTDTLLILSIKYPI